MCFTTFAFNRQRDLVADDDVVPQPLQVGSMDGHSVVLRHAWLDEGDLVRLKGNAAEPNAGNGLYGQTASFMIMGGVLIVQAGAGAGIYAPEDLTVAHALYGARAAPKLSSSGSR